MRTTEEDFRAFKDEFVKWQRKLGLQGYAVCFRHVKDDESFARITTSEKSKKATVDFTKFITREENELEFNPKAHAKHEALHLFLHRLYWLGEQRYTNAGEMDQEWEKIVRILEKVI